MLTKNRMRLAPLAVLALVLPLAACSSDEASGGDGGDGDKVLRVAMGSPGEAQIRVWDAIAADFEEAHDGMTVEMNYQDDDIYETIGLPNLLNGRNAPDVYFEWAGSRIETRQQDGFAADSSEAVASGPLAGLFDPDVLDAGMVDGELILIPHTEDVTNVIWFNKEIFAEHNLTPPTTWEETLSVCAALNDAGVTPMATGNKDLWAAGNWLGHLTSRVVGEDAYSQALSGDASFNTPEWEEAFGFIEELAENKCVNDSANAIDDNEGAQLFFQGKAAMHPIGSWLVSWAIDEAPDLDFDFVNLPAMPGDGDQDSVIGVITGYVINAKSEQQDAAADFLALANSDKFVEEFIAAELVPMTISASEGQEIDERTVRLNDLLNEAPAIVLPPDTGYDLETADAFYRALAEVLGSQSSPADALAALDKKVSD